MVNLEVIFQQVYEGVISKNPRYVIVDCEHVMDNDLGIKYHIYIEYHEKPYAISKDGKVLLTGVQMTETEAEILMSLGKVIGKMYADEQRASFYQINCGIPAPAKTTEVPLRHPL